MIHQSIPADTACKIINSRAYPVLASLNAKLGLVVTDFQELHDKHQYYVMGLDNGLSILHINYGPEEICGSTLDSPFVQAAGFYLNGMVTSKNPRYVVSALTTTQKRAGKRVRHNRNDVLDSAVSTLLSNLAYTIKSKSTPDSTLSAITDEDVHAALEVVIAGEPKINISPTALHRLEVRYNSYINRLNMKNGFSANLNSVFDCEKWFVCSRKSLSGNDHYYVGAFNTAPMVEAVRAGSTSKAFSMETTKVQLYNSLTDLPEEFRNEVIGSLTMFKQYCKANHPGIPMQDKQGYVPYTDYLFDPSSGAVAWRCGTSAFLMVDK